MNENESVDVKPSADNGNLPVDAPIPEATTETVTTEPEATLYELPDGRKVDGATLTREWKENFLPDYTRKSQALAKVATDNLQDKPAADPLDDPEYVPKSYKELVELTEQRTLKKIQAEQEKASQEQKEIENTVSQQITAIKTIDKNLNEDELFNHATKYGFKDLNVAYQNMKDMKELAKNIQQTTAKNIAKKNDPVSAAKTSNATGQSSNPANFASARDYLRSLTK